MSAEIRTLEELSLNAWPAQQTLLLDGWVLRFASGYTRRANSVNPLYPSSLQVEAKILACEALYRQHNLPVIFKMTAANLPTDLDARLAALGYAREADTSVQTLALGQLAGAAPPVDGQMRLESTLSDAWMAAFAHMNASQPAQLIRHRAILEAIQPQTCYAALQIEGSPAACGLAVCQDGWVGLYDILVDNSQRRRGFGEQVVRALLDWASRRQVHSAYLQVMHNNLAALRLYAKLGFREAYSYWYRVK